jgi:hypothetical protein
MPTALMKPVFDERTFSVKRRELKEAPSYNLGQAEREVRNFLDGKRSVLQIRNAVSAELGPVGSKDAENFLIVMEKTGYVTLAKK